jgi:hypothetical protein
VMKQRVAGKTIEIVDRQPRLCRSGEHPVIMQDRDSGSGRWLQNYYKLSERAPDIVAGLWEPGLLRKG